MTTPGGIPNLPVGALTLETLQSKLQDMSGGAMRSRAGERFPAIMGGSSGGSALSDFTPFGILTRIFSEFNSAVANADPADINGPDDLPELLLSFIENLPVVGEFVGLLEAILGTYEGDDEVLLQIQALFGFLRGDGKIDASFLFGELPTAIVDTLKVILGALTGGLLGNIELGQIFRPLAGQEKNWLQSFDDPESVPSGEGFEHDATVGRTAPGSAKVTFDGVEHVRMSDPIEAAAGQVLDLGGYVRFDGYAGSGGPAVALRVLAYSAGDQLVGSQLIGQVTPSGATSADFETVMQTSWTAPANTAYVYVRMEALAAGTSGTGHFDDLWLRKPAQSLPQQWVEGLTGALSNLGDGISDAWNFVQNVIDRFMNGRGILGSLFSLSHFETEVGKVFGPGSSIPGNAIGDLGGLLGSLLPKTDHQSLLDRLGGSGGTVIGQLPKLPDIIGAVTSGANGGTLGGGNPLTDLWNNMFGLHQAAQAALTSAAAANTQLASQQQDTESGDAGVSYGTTFGGGNEAALGGPWTSSDVVIKNGYAGLRDAATTNGSNYLAKTSNTASRDDFVVAVVLGDQGDAANTRIVTRADLNFTMGVYVNINKSGLQLGRWTNNGGTLTQWASVTVNVSGGAAVRVRAVGNQYTVFLNGVDVLSYTDTGAAAPFGPAYRSAGFTLGTDTGFFGYRYYSFRLASFMLADYNPPGASVTASWRLSRSSATTVNFASNLSAASSSALVGGYLTASENAAAVTVTDLGRGQVKINQAGHYWMQFNSRGTYYNNSSDTPFTANLGEVGWVLLVNGTVATGHITPGVPYLMFLNVNDVVAPGVMFATSFYGTNYSYLQGLNGPASFTGYRLGA